MVHSGVGTNMGQRSGDSGMKKLFALIFAVLLSFSAFGQVTFKVGTLQASGPITTPWANAAFEHGSTSAVNTPFISFHSSGNAISYDTRIIAGGGTASIGQGSLTVIAATTSFTGAITHAQQEVDTSYTFSTPTTGQTVTLASGRPRLSSRPERSPR
jgi:hypothetical protein